MRFRRADRSGPAGRAAQPGAGIPDYLNEPGATWPPRPATPAQLIAAFRDLPLGFPPGTRMRYSNSGYVLAGSLVQRIAGQPLASFLTQRIFGPLGMHRTGTDTTAIRPGHAAGYYASGQRPVAYPMSAFFAAGGLHPPSATSTAGIRPCRPAG